MGQKKDVLSVSEAKQQFRNSLAAFQPTEILKDNILKIAAASFLAGMVSADSAKSREKMVELAVASIKKFL